MFSQAGVKNSDHSGGGEVPGFLPPLGPGTPPDHIPPGTRYTPSGPGTPPRPGTPPWDQVHPPGPGIPPRDQVHTQDQVPPDQVHPPGTMDTPRDQVQYNPEPGIPPRTEVHPPEPGTPPRAVHVGRYGQQAGGTHPTGMHSC